MFRFSQLARKPKVDNVEDIDKWLFDVMVFIAPVMPKLTDQQTILNTIVGGNPAILLLREYGEHILRMCNYLSGLDPVTFRNKDYMMVLPLAIYQFNSSVVPIYDHVNRADRESLYKCYPEYAEALFGSKKDTSDVGNDSENGE